MVTVYFRHCVPTKDRWRRKAVLLFSLRDVKCKRIRPVNTREATGELIGITRENERGNERSRLSPGWWMLPFAVIGLVVWYHLLKWALNLVF